MKVLFRIQAMLNTLAEHPLAFAVACVFLGFWLGTYFVSGGKFDPGLGIGNLIINGLGLVLMFCACSLAAHAAHSSDARDDSHELIHEKLDALHEKLDAK